MNIYEELGIEPIINAQDSETVLGGSIVPDEILEKMQEANKYFVEIKQLEKRLSKKIAQMTKNESCLLTNGAAAGIAVSVAGCIAQGRIDVSQKMPDISHISKREVIMFQDQKNNYDNAIWLAGGKVIKAKNSMADFKKKINENTACIVYFAGTHYKQFAPPLDQIISLANENNIPVIVDAAANLPPVNNLWRYTKDLGAALVAFSGGKTLKGPQGSGLLLGKEKYINYCRSAYSPNKGIARSMKISREEMVGLYYAVKRYLNLDHDKIREKHEEIVAQLRNALVKVNNQLAFERVYPAAHGQDYPRLKVVFKDDAEKLFYYEGLLKSSPKIFTKLNTDEPSIIINPLHLTDQDIELIIDRFKQLFLENNI